jgi:hypothetical protein
MRIPFIQSAVGDLGLSKDLPANLVRESFNASLINNVAGGMLLYTLIITLHYIIQVLLQKYKISSVLKKWNNNLFSLSLNVIYAEFMILTFSSFVQITVVESFDQKLAIVLSCFGVSASIFIIFKSKNLIFQNFPLLTREETLALFSSLVDDYSLTSQRKAAFKSVLLLKRYLFLYLLATVHLERVGLQLNLMAVISSVYVVAIIIVRPRKIILNDVKNILSEGMLLVVLIQLRNMQTLDPNKMFEYGWTIIGSAIWILIVHITGYLISTIFAAYNFFFKRDYQDAAESDEGDEKKENASVYII